MKVDQLQKKLLAAARAHPPGDRVPFAFEKRILTRLKKSPALDGAALWARALWRAAAACVALALLLSVWSLVGASHNTVADNTKNAGKIDSAGYEDFSQHFEQTMLAGVNESEEVW
jgi:branched-subunit amino acid permease